MTMFKIVEGTERGRAIVATQQIEPGCLGKEVFTERALMVFPTHGSNEDRSPAVPQILKPEPGPQMWSDWISYLEQPQDLKDRIFQMYTDMTCRTLIIHVLSVGFLPSVVIHDPKLSR